MAVHINRKCCKHPTSRTEIKALQ